MTLYESADRQGGWIHTVKKETDGGVVHFENGPRMLRGLGKTGFRADDYVFYDLVWIAALLLLPELGIWGLVVLTVD